eukprot:scaffold242008_cov18-Tisochrysis_lutea.AAC.1
MSSDPDTILVPSGENAAEMISRLWALAFSLLSSSVPAWARRRGQIWPRGEPLIVLSNDPDTIFDLGPVRGKRDRGDPMAMGVGLLALEL